MAELIQPHLDEDLADGFSISRKNGRLVMTRTFFAINLTGATPPERLAQALLLHAGTGAAEHTGANLPDDGDEVEINDKTLSANDFAVSPWGAADAEIRVTYTEDLRDQDFAGYGPTIKEVGATVEEEETDFDYANLQLPLDQRTRIKVRYDPDASPPSGSSTEKKAQDARVRRWRGRPVIIFTREQSHDPEDLAADYVSMINSAVWRGYAAGTVLCISILGRNAGDGKWVTTYQFAVDKHGFKQYARWIDPETGLPPSLLTFMIGHQNGITEVTVQGEANFAGLNLPA